MKSFFLVIRLDFVPFGSFLALSLSFLRSYTLLQEGSLSWCNTKSVTQLTNSLVVLMLFLATMQRYKIISSHEQQME